LAFFDDEVQVASKELMAAALSLEGKDEQCRRIQMEHKERRYEEALRFCHYKYQAVLHST